MKAIKYVCCVLVVVCFVNLAKSERPRNQMNQQLFDAFNNVDRSTRMKRPFCNAFSGCGWKRDQTETQDLKPNDFVRLPFFKYKALLKAAESGCIKNTIDQDGNDYQSLDIPQVYLSQKIPISKRFDNPLTSLD